MQIGLVEGSSLYMKIYANSGNRGIGAVINGRFKDAGIGE